MITRYELMCQFENAWIYRRRNKKFKPYAWRYLVLFSLLYCFQYCTRLNLSNAGAVMIDSLGWTKADFGMLTGALFWAYGIGQFVNGRLSEIVGPAKFVVASIVLSAAAKRILEEERGVKADR